MGSESVHALASAESHGQSGYTRACQMGMGHWVNGTRYLALEPHNTKWGTGCRPAGDRLGTDWAP